MLHLRNKSREIPIPFGGGNHTVTEDGIVKRDNEPLPHSIKDNKRFVKFSWIWGDKEYDVALIMLHSFKRTCLPVLFWNLLDYHQCNAEYNVDSFIWSFPKGGIRAGVNGQYRHIPAFTRYGIDDDANIVDLITGEPVRTYVGRDGYVSVSLKSDIGIKKLVSRHRCQLLAAGDYPANASKLDVNHDNLTPGDDKLSNLSWMSRSENVKHGIMMRKHLGNTADTLTGKLDVKNIETGDEYCNLSIDTAARTMNVSSNCLRRYLRKEQYLIINGIWTYKWSDSSGYNVNSDQWHFKAVSVLFLESGVEKHYSQMTEAAKDLGLTNDGVKHRLTYKNQPLWPGYVLMKYRNDPTPWRLTTIADCNEPVASTSKIVLVLDVITKEVKEFETLASVVNYLGISASKLSTAANNPDQLAIATQKGVVIVKYKFSDGELRAPLAFPDELYYSGIAKDWISVTDIQSNETITYANSKVAARVLDLSPSTFSYFLQMKDKVVNSRYLIKKWSPQDPLLPEFNYGSH